MVELGGAEPRFDIFDNPGRLRSVFQMELDAIYLWAAEILRRGIIHSGVIFSKYRLVKQTGMVGVL